nr:MAG TPA: hypothetical protein [Bacteriophage sp.]
MYYPYFQISLIFILLKSKIIKKKCQFRTYVCNTYIY